MDSDNSETNDMTVNEFDKYFFVSNSIKNENEMSLDQYEKIANDLIESINQLIHKRSIEE